MPLTIQSPKQSNWVEYLMITLIGRIFTHLGFKIWCTLDFINGDIWCDFALCICVSEKNCGTNYHFLMTAQSSLPTENSKR